MLVQFYRGRQTMDIPQRGTICRARPRLEATLPDPYETAEDRRRLVG